MRTKRTATPPSYYLVITAMFFCLLSSGASAQRSEPTAPSLPGNSPPNSVNTDCGGFTDTPGAYPYICSALQYMTVTHHYISGYDPSQCFARGATYPCFVPGDLVSRAEFSRILVNSYNWAIDVSGGPHFTDVPQTYFAYAQIETIYHHSVITGYDATSCANAGHTYPCFLPDNQIRRSEAAAFLVRAAGYALFTPSSSDFIDVSPSDPNSGWAYSYIETLYYNAVVYPVNGGYYYPVVHIKRADTAYYVYRLIYYNQINSFLGQIFGRRYVSGGYWGVDVVKRANYIANKGTSWAIGPVGVSDFANAFIELGPSVNYYNVDDNGNYTGDGGFHPYSGWYRNNVNRGKVDVSINLIVDRNDRYKASYNSSTSKWSAYICPPLTICKQETPDLNLGGYVLTYVGSGAETNKVITHLGNTVTSYARYTLSGGTVTSWWCYDTSDILNDEGDFGGTIALDQCDSSNQVWIIQWPPSNWP